MRRPSAGSGIAWSVVAGLWSLVFAAPHFYWALGGRGGLGAQRAAADDALGQTWFSAYNLAAGCLGILGALVAAVLAAGWGGRRLRRWALIAAAVAAVLLGVRGLFGTGLLLAGAFGGASGEEPPPPILLAIEPWFVAGGLVFGAMFLRQRAAIQAAARQEP